MHWYYKTLLLLALSLGAAPATISATFAEQNTFLKGKVDNPKVQQLALYFYRDYISMDEEIFYIPLDSNQQFSIKFKLSEPALGKLIYKSEEIPLFMEPGNYLELTIDDTSSPLSINFEGTGSAENTFFTSFYRKFEYAINDGLFYELIGKAPLIFKTALDKKRNEKWAYFNSYTPFFKKQFSAAFKQYIYAEIDYCWAYYLLRYRQEHASTDKSSFPDLPDSYFDFLNEILISNDQALNNRHYLFFLDQYLLFKKQMLHTMGKLSLNTTQIRITAPSMLLLSEPERPPVLRQLNQGESLQYLKEKSDFRSKVMIKEVLYEDYWYKVRTVDGLVGWIIGAGATFEEQADSFSVNMRELLYGKTKEYQMARDLYRRLPLENKENSEKAIEELIFLKVDERYLNKVKNAFDKLYPEKEIAYDTINYLVFDEPTVIKQDEWGNNMPDVSAMNAYSRYQLQGVEDRQNQLSYASNFSLTDINGQLVSLSDLRGKVIYLDFWASWCTPCIYQMKNSRIWKSKFDKKEVAFVYVSLDEQKEQWQSFVNRQGFDGIHLFAKGAYQSQIAQNYRVDKLPCLYIIDQKGRIVYNSTKEQLYMSSEDFIRYLLSFE